MSNGKPYSIRPCVMTNPETTTNESYFRFDEDDKM